MGPCVLRLRRTGCWCGKVTGQRKTCAEPIYPPSSYSSLTEKAGPSQGPLTQSEGSALHFAQPSSEATRPTKCFPNLLDLFHLSFLEWDQMEHLKTPHLSIFFSASVLIIGNSHWPPIGVTQELCFCSLTLYLLCIKIEGASVFKRRPTPKLGAKKTKILADWSCHTPTRDEVGTFLDKSAGIQNGKSLSSILSLLTDYPCKHVFKLILFSEFFFLLLLSQMN